MNRQLPGAVARAGTALSFGLLAAALIDSPTSAQDRLKTMPGYAQYLKMSTQLSGAVRSGAINGAWSADGASVDYVLDGKPPGVRVGQLGGSETKRLLDADAPAVFVPAGYLLFPRQGRPRSRNVANG